MDIGKYTRLANAYHDQKGTDKAARILEALKAEEADTWTEEAAALMDVEEIPYTGDLGRYREASAYARKAAADAKARKDAFERSAALAALLAEYQANLKRGCDPNASEMIQAAAKIQELSRTVAPSKYAFDLAPDSWDTIAGALKNKPPAYESRFTIARSEAEGGEKLTFPTGGLSFIAAPSGHGKTTLLMNLLADAVNMEPARRHWLFSFEEDAPTVYLKTFNAWANEKFSASNMATFYDYFRNGDSQYFKAGMAATFKEKLAAFQNKISSGALNIRQGDFSSEHLCAAIRALSKNRPGIITIDYAQLLYQEEPGYLKRMEELKQICLDLKDVAIETGACIILAAQFNREARNADDMIPQRLADASDIEKAASKIIALWNGNKKAEGLATDGGKKTLAGSLHEAAKIGEDTVFLKVIKDRNGTTEKWATYQFTGNHLHIARDPIISGKGPKAQTDHEAIKQTKAAGPTAAPDAAELRSHISKGKKT